MAFFVSFVLFALAQFCVLFASTAYGVVGGGGSDGYFADGKPTKTGWINIGAAAVVLLIGFFSQTQVLSAAVASTMVIIYFARGKRGRRQR